MRAAILCAVLAFSVAACGYLDDDWTVDGPYRLRAPDDPAQFSICYELGSGDCIGRIPAKVIGFGHDDRYVVGTVRSASGRIVHYYIVRSADGPFAERSVVVRGPFEDAAFNVEKSRLNLPDATPLL